MKILEAKKKIMYDSAKTKKKSCTYINILYRIFIII